MGGKTEYVQQPAAPTPPSATATLQEYIQNYPQLVELQKQYAPQLAAVDYSIQQQYQPQQLALGEDLAGIAQKGMTTTAPEFYQQDTRDRLKSTFGRNLVFNPAAQEQYGLATQQANEDWKRYYANMGMSLSNKVPLTQNTMGAAQSYTPSQALNMASNTYSTQGGIYGNQMSYNLGMQQYSPQNQMYNLAGSIGGGIAGGMMGRYF